MTATTAIPEDRPLTPEESSLVRWLLNHGISEATSFVPQLDRAKVVSRCYCGCASVDFAIDGVVPSLVEGMQILADYQFESSEGYKLGVFVFARSGMLAGLEVWSMDGLSDARLLPEVEQLYPLIAEGEEPR